jgi:hypothetical protein
MMIKILESGKIEELEAVSSSGVEFTRDLLGNNDALHFNDDTDEFEMKEEDFDWWKEYIDNYNSDEIKKEEIIEELNDLELDGKEIVETVLSNTEFGCDLSDEHMIKQNVFEDIKNEYHL